MKRINSSLLTSGYSRPSSHTVSDRNHADNDIALVIAKVTERCKPPIRTNSALKTNPCPVSMSFLALPVSQPSSPHSPWATYTSPMAPPSRAALDDDLPRVVQARDGKQMNTWDGLENKDEDVPEKAQPDLV